MEGFARTSVAGLAAAAALALSLVAAPRARADQLPFTIWNAAATRLESGESVAPIPPGFVGASIDYCSITRYNDGTAAEPILAHLLASLASGRPLLRVGGPGPEAPCGDRKDRSLDVTIAAIRSLALTLHAKLILGINLQAHRPDWVRSEVAELLHGIDPNRPHKYVAAFEIGNEPDLYPRYGPSVPPAGVEGYFRRFMLDFSRWSRIIRRVAGDPSFPVAGPGLGRFGFPWITGMHRDNFDAFVNGPARPQYLAFHSYPLFGAGDPCPNIDCPSISNLLLDSSSHGLAEGLAQFAGRVPRGRELRVDEINSITSGGARGVSNTFASALWALDTLFEMAQTGVGGVNIHTFPGAAYALFSHSLRGRWSVHPEYYGLLTFARAAPAGSLLLRVTPDLTATGGPSVKVWATRGLDGKVRIVIINKDLQAHYVVLRGAGLPSTGGAVLERLLAPPTPGAKDCPTGYSETGLCATSGVTLGGQTFGARATAPLSGDETSNGLLPKPGVDCGIPNLARSCVMLLSSGTTIPMPAGSAAILIGARPYAIGSMPRWIESARARTSAPD